MNILQLVMIGLAGTILAVTLKKYNPEISLLVGLSTGVLIFLSLLSGLREVVETLQKMAQAAGIQSRYLESVLKVIGISYIAEFGAQVCTDAGQGAIASKLELAGKALILVIAAPILFDLMNTIMNLFV